MFGLFKPDETVFSEETAVLTALSDENGVFEFKNIPCGEWIIKELKAPHGYELNGKEYRIKISENGQAADFVIKLVKTIRGYGGIFISATQNIIDYFALSGGKFGDAVIGNSRLKLLLQTEEPEAVKLKEKLGLSDEEVMQIIRCGRGQGLLCAGKNRTAVEIRSTETEAVFGGFLGVVIMCCMQIESIEDNKKDSFRGE